VLPRAEDETQRSRRHSDEDVHHLDDRPGDGGGELGNDLEGRHGEGEREETGIESRAREGGDRTGDGGALSGRGLGEHSVLGQAARVVKSHGESKLADQMHSLPPTAG